MDQSDFLKRFEHIKTWKRGNQRAPHKPLLLLFALGRYSRKGARMIPYEQIDRKLSQLLRDFGPSRKSYHTEYPFWRLQNDNNLWELINTDLLEADLTKDVKKTELLKYQVAGGFPEDLYQHLIQYPEEMGKLVSQILEDHFPESISEDILQAVGFLPSSEDYQYDIVRRKRRDPSFRYAVLDAYNGRCAMCGFDVRMGEKSIGLEAAHIHWDSHNGPNIIQNGLLLCAIHHKLFDRGAWTIKPDGMITISPHVHGTIGLQEWVLRFEGKALHLPTSTIQEPSQQYGNWHRKEVFKKS